jgi:hypothetical protein
MARRNAAIERGHSSSPGSIISMIFLGEPSSACFVVDISSAVNSLAGSLLSNRFRSKLSVGSRASQRTVAALPVLFLSGGCCSPKVGRRKNGVARALSALRSDLRLGRSSATCPARVRKVLNRNSRSSRNVDVRKGDITDLEFEREDRLDCRGGKYSPDGTYVRRTCVRREVVPGSRGPSAGAARGVPTRPTPRGFKPLGRTPADGLRLFAHLMELDGLEPPTLGARTRLVHGVRTAPGCPAPT